MTVAACTLARMSLTRVRSWYTCACVSLRIGSSGIAPALPPGLWALAFVCTVASQPKQSDEHVSGGRAIAHAQKRKQKPKPKQVN